MLSHVAIVFVVAYSFMKISRIVLEFREDMNIIYDKLLFFNFKELLPHNMQS